MIECNLGKIWKTHPPRCPKISIPKVLHIKISFLLLISNGLNGFDINIDCVFFFFFLLFVLTYLVTKHNHLISSNKM